MISSIEIFFSYSHEDESLKDQLLKHLSNLKRQGVITVWHDRKIGAGREWAHQIDEHLNKASIILLLVSPDFMSSDYCNDIEVKRALERHEAREACVIPIILRPVDWKGAIFEKLQALPSDSRPVSTWTNSDEAFVNIVEGIRSATIQLRAGQLWSQLLAVKYEEIDKKIGLGEQILALNPDFQAFSDTSIQCYLAALYVNRGHESQRAVSPDAMLGVFGRPSSTEDARLKIYKRALLDFDRAIALCPNVAEHYYSRGWLRAKSFSFDDKPVSNQEMIIRRHSEILDYNGALEDYTHAIELAPEEGKYYYARAVLLDPQLESVERFFRKPDMKKTARQLQAARDVERATQLGFLDPETGEPKFDLSGMLRTINHG